MNEYVTIGEAIQQATESIPSVKEQDENQAALTADRVTFLNSWYYTHLGDMDVPPDLRKLARKPFDIGLQPTWDEASVRPVLMDAWDTLKAGRWVTLQGGTGVGKTHLAIRWLWMLRLLQPFYDHSSAWKYVNARTWSLRYVDPRAGGYSFFEDTLDARWILLDDIGQEASSRRREGIADLISAAGDRRRQLIITTNCSTPELVDRYGASIVSRIDSAGNKIINLTGKDLR